MNRINEFNGRLENLVGVKNANIICTASEQVADEYCMKYKVNPQSSEHLAILYQVLMDKVLIQYETAKKPRK